MDLPIHRKLFFAFGPVLTLGKDDAPYAWGWKPIDPSKLTELILTDLDRHGKWEVDDDGNQVLVKKYATCEQLERELGEARCAVLDGSDYKFAVYGDTVVDLVRYDPRSMRSVLVLTPEEFERTQQ